MYLSVQAPGEPKPLYKYQFQDINLNLNRSLSVGELKKVYMLYGNNNIDYSEIFYKLKDLLLKFTNDDSYIYYPVEYTDNLYKRSIQLGLKFKNLNLGRKQVIYKEGNNNDGLEIYIDGNGKLHYKIQSKSSGWNGVNEEINVQLNENEWYVIVVVLDQTTSIQNDTYKFYLNGQLVHSTYGKFIPPHEDIYIGNDETKNNQFRGYLYQYYIFNDVINEDDITKNGDFLNRFSQELQQIEVNFYDNNIDFLKLSNFCSESNTNLINRILFEDHFDDLSKWTVLIHRNGQTYSLTEIDGKKCLKVYDPYQHSGSNVLLGSNLFLPSENGFTASFDIYIIPHQGNPSLYFYSPDLDKNLLGINTCSGYNWFNYYVYNRGWVYSKDHRNEYLNNWGHMKIEFDYINEKIRIYLQDGHIEEFNVDFSEFIGKSLQLRLTGGSGCYPLGPQHEFHLQNVVIEDIKPIKEDSIKGFVKEPKYLFQNLFAGIQVSYELINQ